MPVHLKKFDMEKLLSKFGENNLNTFLDDQGRTLESLTEREAAFLTQFNSLHTAGARFHRAVTKRVLEDVFGKEEAAKQLSLFQHREGVLKGAIDFIDSTHKAIIGLFQGSDVTTIIREKEV